jgi:hypothetical protein
MRLRTVFMITGIGVHDPPESVFTIDWNGCSRSNGIRVLIHRNPQAIRTAFDQGGEFSAAVELRRIFPGITDNAKARYWARVIAGWKPLPPRPPKKPICRPRTRSSTW